MEKYRYWIMLSILAFCSIALSGCGGKLINRLI
jgi:hypothetical protein